MRKGMDEPLQFVILIAEDDPDDKLLCQDAFKIVCVRSQLHFVNDGAEAINYLHREGQYSDQKSAPRPDLILLDIRMPRKNGWQVLEEVKANPALRDIPTVILTTSCDEEDKRRANELGAQDFYSKSVSFSGLVQSIHSICQTWLDGHQPA